MLRAQGREGPKGARVSVRILFVEDSQDDVELQLRRLREADLQPHWDRVQTEEKLRAALTDETWHVALVDYNIPGFSGIGALRLIAELAPDLPAVTVSGAIDEDTAVATISAGAVDYVLKDNLIRLAPAVRSAIGSADLRRAHRQAAEAARLALFAVDNASLAVTMVARDGTVVYVNDYACKTFAGERGDLVGEMIWDLDAAMKRESWDETWARVVAEGAIEFRVDRRQADGSRLVLDVTTNHLEDADVLVSYSRDITRRVEAEEQARASEALYRRIVEMASEGIWARDAEHRTTFANAQMAGMLGLKPRDMLGRPVTDYVFDEDLESFREEMGRRAGRASGSYRGRLRRADGGETWVEVSSVPDVDADGGIVGSFGMFTDITERRLADEALRAERANLAAIFEASPVAMLVCDAGANVVRLNRAALRLAGRDGEALLEHRADSEVQCGDVLGCVHHYQAEDGCGTSPECPLCPLRNAVAAVLDAAVNMRGVEFSLEVLRDGEPEEVWLRIGAEPMVMDGAPHVTVAVEDITDRRRAESALAESEERYRAMFERNRAVKLLIEPETGAIVDANPAAADFHGYSYDRLCGLNIADLNTLPAEELEAALAQAAGSEVSTFLFRHRLASGELRDVEVNTGPVDVGSRTLLYSIVHDVTERIKAESALRESEERFRSLAERVPGFVSIKDADQRYLYLSSLRGAKVSGGKEAWIGKLPGDVWSDDEAQTSRDAAERALAGEMVDELVCIGDKDGRHFRSVHFPITLEDGTALVGGLMLDVTAQVEAEEEVRRQAEQLRRTVEGAVLAMSQVVETRDPYTAGHERRVAELATVIGRDMGLTAAELDGLRLGALIHDIGKIAVPAEILAKPGRLSAVEFNLIKQHPRSGYDILSVIDFGRPVAEMVLQHHERLDGSGYPQGLTTQDLLPETCILAVADVVEAMSSHRPYRAALGREAALAEIRDGAGTRYDPDVVAACERVMEGGFHFSP